MSTDREDELRDLQHAVALLRHHRAEDAEAFVGLLNDPDVDPIGVVARLCDLVRTAWVAGGFDPDAYLDEITVEVLAAAVDPAAFIARWDGPPGESTS